ncbi:hypothetical protein AN641_08165 [Candidatus Epulonipiscioides gigas]|nr:hypothetical protein AN641_08165 [Epulopiscium sp. SCG-C07WGA-EpuloA2]
MAPTPGYDDPDAWKMSSYSNYRDDRAVEETLSIAREPGVAKFGYEDVIVASVNTNLFINRIYINNMTPVEAVESIRGIW